MMFVLTEMQDIVRIEPHKFSHDMGQQLSEELNKKFANKVSLIIQLSVIEEVSASILIEFFYVDAGCAQSGSLYSTA